MSGIVRKRNGSFTVVNNSIFDDGRLSMEALGLLTWLLSKPDNWRVIQSHIAAVFKIGKDKTYRVIGELIEHGYLVKQLNRDDDGEFSGITYIVYDNPINASVSPFPENPEAVKPKAVNPPLVKTERKQELKVVENSLFKAFWDQYPNKTAKAYSEKQFSKLSPQEQSAVVASMPKFLEWLEAKHKTFKDYSPPNPSTYINQRRFDDYRAAPLDWEQIIDTARLLDAWSPKKWGPAPFTDGCIVPRELLTQSDNRPWKEWRPAS
jgi:DNA replication protein DnaC